MKLGDAPVALALADDDDRPSVRWMLLIADEEPWTGTGVPLAAEGGDMNRSSSRPPALAVPAGTAHVAGPAAEGAADGKDADEDEDDGANRPKSSALPPPDGRLTPPPLALALWALAVPLGLLTGALPG